MPNDKIVQLPSGERVQFPASMADADVNSAIEQYLGSKQTGAMQSRPGGPVFNARSATPQTAQGPTAGGIAREGALGLTSAILPEGSGSTDWKQNLATIFRGLNEQVNRAATTPWGQGGPIYGTAEMIGKGILGGAHGAASGLEELGGGMWNKDPEKAAHGGGAFIGNLATLGLLKKTPEALGDPIGRESVQNLMNQGPAKASFLQRQVERARSTQSAVKSTLDAVHEDGKSLIGHVSQSVDAAEPNGAFNRTDVHAAVKDAMGVVKADQRVPAAITKVLESGEAGPRSTGPTVGGRHFDLSNPSDLKAYQKMKASGAFTPEEIQRMEGGGGEGKMSFEELKQIHSDIGRQMANTEGPVEAGVRTAYAKLSEMLRNKAESHGMLNEWSEGAAKVKTFYDTAYRSPLKDTYFGGDHGKIMKPLVSDDLGPQVKPLLEKIAPYGLDMDRLQQTVNGYRYGERMDMLNEPSRMTPILAAISPKMAAMRVAIPRAMRTGGMTEHLYGRGLETVPPEPVQPLSPSKVYPSKAAALKATKSGNGPMGGVNASGFEASLKPTNKAQAISSLSNEIDTMKTKLRNAQGASSADKAALAKQISDYQERLQELRGN